MLYKLVMGKAFKRCHHMVRDDQLMSVVFCAKYIGLDTRNYVYILHVHHSVPEDIIEYTDETQLGHETNYGWSEKEKHRP